VPICICPLAIRWPPNHITATLETFITSMTVGNISAMRRPTRMDTFIRSVLAPSNRCCFVGVLHERADDPDAADLLAQDPVDQVDLFLHRPEQRAHLRDDRRHAHQQDRHDDEQERGQCHVLAKRHDDPAEAHDRRGDHDREGQ
jgi:hypothetical protein